VLIYELASVEDRGSYWTVTGLTTNGLDTVDQEEKHLKLSHSAYKIIQDAIMKGHEVRVIKPLQVNEVLPGEVKIVEVEEDDIVAFRNSAIRRVRMVVNPEFVSVSGLSFYGFICLNNELADKGFFITDENRESKYLAILETGDEKLIAKLEDYLNYRDEIGRTAAFYKSFEEFRRNVNNETDKDKITKLADDFLEVFYSRF
jgi:hypothetical protein